MVITKEISLENFECWNGAEDTLDRIINHDLCDTFECVLEELYPNGIDETELNDLLKYESDWCYECVGLRTESVIRDDVADIEYEMERLEEEFNYDIENENIENKNKHWSENYANDFLELKEQLDELEEELKEF